MSGTLYHQGNRLIAFDVHLNVHPVQETNALEHMPLLLSV